MARSLLLVPTARERDLLLDGAPELARTADVALVGFGPVAAAARTAALLAGPERRSRVVLVGIAGGYPEGPAVGQATEFGRVRLDGVGALGGDGLLTPRAMGLPQWTLAGGATVDDELPLAGAGPELLTVCAAAGSATDVAERLARAPSAAAEDMEGFAVAFAAALAGVPCHVVRGTSNRAGDRDHARWEVAGALAAAAAVVRERGLHL